MSGDFDFAVLVLGFRRKDNCQLHLHLTPFTKSKINARKMDSSLFLMKSTTTIKQSSDKLA